MDVRGESFVRRMLVVDDEFTSRVILQKFLSAHGEVQVCTNGLEAVEAFSSALEKGEPFTLICLDVMMPVMTGIQALSKIREIEASRGIVRASGVKVLMTTGMDAHDDALDEARSLFDTTMTKPFRLHRVADALVSLGLG
jgi:two-component system, chemotaxis family, chemotaxis protein CheY